MTQDDGRVILAQYARRLCDRSAGSLLVDPPAYNAKIAVLESLGWVACKAHVKEGHVLYEVTLTQEGLRELRSTTCYAIPYDLAGVEKLEWSIVEDVEFSDEFCRFLKTSIPTVDAAELLLLLYGRRQDAFTPEAAVARLRPGVTIGDTGRSLESFAAGGLAEVAQGRYRFRDSALSPMVETLAHAFSHRPVTLIRIIYALRDTKIQTFADAFRLRKT